MEFSLREAAIVTKQISELAMDFLYEHMHSISDVRTAVQSEAPSCSLSPVCSKIRVEEGPFAVRPDVNDRCRKGLLFLKLFESFRMVSESFAERWDAERWD